MRKSAVHGVIHSACKHIACMRYSGKYLRLQVQMQLFIVREDLKNAFQHLKEITDAPELELKVQWNGHYRIFVQNFSVRDPAYYKIKSTSQALRAPE